MTKAAEYPFDADTLKQLIIDVHQDNVDMGWWALPRDIHTFTCLFNSELAEATEGIRKNLMDDKLPQYANAPVEMADFAIRLMDYLGSCCEDGGAMVVFDNALLGVANKIPATSGSTLSTQFIATMYHVTAAARQAHLAGSYSFSMTLLMGALVGTLKGLHDLGYPIMEIIQAKRDFNKVRADHKIENRLNGERGSKTF